MKKNIIVLFLILGTFVISGCSTLNKEVSTNNEESVKVVKITSEEAKGRDEQWGCNNIRCKNRRRV